MKDRLEDIYGERKGTVNVDGKIYYFKRNDAYVELIVEKIADLFGIRHAHYEPVCVNGQNFYLSEDLNYQGRFMTAEDYGLSEVYKIKDYDEFILTRFPGEYDQIMEQFMKMFFMDLLILNIDRHNDNWGFLLTADGVDLCILDNDLSFIDATSLISGMDNNYRFSSYLEVKNILETFPQELVNLFIEMFNTINIDKLKEIIAGIEEERGIKIPYKENYYGRLSLFRYRVESLLHEKKLLMV